MKIGNLELGPVPLFLAPMEDVTDPSFRYVCKRFGADMMYTEFVSADGLIRDARKSLAKLRLADEERPIGIQIYGNEIEPMVEAARMAEAAGPEVIDINFGCPVKKIAGRGAGSGMMRDVPKMVEMTRRIVQAVRLPVTVKTRLGWDEESKNIEEIALRLQDVGIQALTIHGRTRAQLYRGEADWTLIGAVKNHPSIRIPIIGNGDIDSGPKAAQMLERYGVDGLMIGRATFGRPWIFREVRHFLETGEELPQPTVRERVALARDHLARSVELKGERTGVLEMRRHLSSYFKGLPDFRETRARLVTEPEAEGVARLLDYIGERWGEWDATGTVPPFIYDRPQGEQR
ncbi:tRNA dihydrouridine synthase DusB [uncultured Rikenella sp.]|uniref:tRNA dihydrouridine synthase DusB n=1 Tax=uncultured Rikenella sp. TaxID=368003 RepID=UPI0025D6CAF0|nr:tRNA dihydrouridine synthase DusB [uncultured Rikenella sp.]